MTIKFLLAGCAKLALLACLAAAPVAAQTATAQAPLALPDAPAGRHTAAILVGTSLALAAYGKSNWWQDGFRGRFNTVNEGWFGQHTYSGGADKLGHFYMTYAGSRLLTRVLAWDGASDAHALNVAAWYTLGAFAAIEVADGFSKEWDFSREDMLMNAAGVGIGVLLERRPDLDRVFDVRMLYRPSRETGRRFDPFGDYSGQTYLLVTKLAGFPALRRRGMLRYVEIAVGYGARAYEDHGSKGGARNIYVGVSLNLSELIGNVQAGQAGTARRWANTALEYVQIPGTALLTGHTLRSDSRAQPRQDKP